MNAILKPNFQGIAENVKISRTRMTIALTHVIELETEVLVHFFGDAGVDAIADPRVKVGVIEDFVGDKTRETPNMQRPFELHPVSIMNEIKRRCAPMIFKPITITKRHHTERKSHRGFYG